MAPAVYVLGIVVSLACSLLLLRAYVRVRQELLLWSGLCFAGLAVSNLLVFVDLVVLSVSIDLYRWRLGTAAVSVLLLVYGLIWEGE